jgi:hypothetical protein
MTGRFRRLTVPAVGRLTADAIVVTLSPILRHDLKPRGEGQDESLQSHWQGRRSHGR